MIDIALVLLYGLGVVILYLRRKCRPYYMGPRDAADYCAVGFFGCLARCGCRSFWLVLSFVGVNEMNSWPAHQWTLKRACRIHTIINDSLYAHFCPLCLQEGNRYTLELEYVQWRSTTVWYKPWTWNSGYWVDMRGRKYKET